MALVAGKNLVPKPATGMTAFVTGMASTLGQEFYMFCGFPPKNINEILFSKYQLKDYLKQNKCILDQLKQSGYRTNFIHTYKSTFNTSTTNFSFGAKLSQKNKRNNFCAREM